MNSPGVPMAALDMSAALKKTNVLKPRIARKLLLQ